MNNILSRFLHIVVVLGLSLSMAAAPFNPTWQGKGVHEHDNLNPSITTDQKTNIFSKLSASNVKHGAVNIPVEAIFPSTGGDRSFIFEGTSYSYSSYWETLLKNRITDLINAGIEPTAIVVLGWGGNSNFYYTGVTTGADRYAFNMQTTLGRRSLRAAIKWVNSKVHSSVKWFIVGNEVQNPVVWNNYGTYSGSGQWQAHEYGEALKEANTVVKSFNSSGKVFASFERRWSTHTDGKLSGKSILDYLVSNYGTFDWGVAWHPYTELLNKTNSTTTLSNSTLDVNMKNLEVLVHYLNYTTNKYSGSQRTLMLTEQGYSNSDQKKQAAGYAYFYRKAATNEGVTAMHWIPFINRDGDEGWTSADWWGGVLTNFPDLEEKESYSVFRDASESNWQSTFDSASLNLKSYLGTSTGALSQWEDIYPSVVRKQVGTISIKNLSHRAKVLPSAEIIGGFVISGSTREVLFRGVSKILSLPPYNMPGTLGDAKIEIANSSGVVVASNNDFSSYTAPEQTTINLKTKEVGGFAIDSTDAVVLKSLAPGSYSVRVKSQDGSSGTALCEIYATSVGTGKLVNVSGNSYIDSTNDAVSSVVMSGTGSMDLLLRSVGPTITDMGISGYITNPKLEWVNAVSQHLYRENLDWGGNDLNLYKTSPTAVSVGAFPLSAGSDDASVFVRVYEGAYSLITKSHDGDSGRVLTEIYDAN